VISAEYPLYTMRLIGPSFILLNNALIEKELTQFFDKPLIHFRMSPFCVWLDYVEALPVEFGKEM